MRSYKLFTCSNSQCSTPTSLSYIKTIVFETSKRHREQNQLLAYKLPYMHFRMVWNKPAKYMYVCMVMRL